MYIKVRGSFTAVASKVMFLEWSVTELTAYPDCCGYVGLSTVIVNPTC